jgi:uncharacterized protein YdhG (YjbR/CyaY superfamily)
MDTTFQTIDQYLLSLPQAIRQRCETLREVIQKAAPDATEKISYQMPTFFLNGNLVHFAAQKNHIGFYPGPEGISKFQSEFGNLRFSKGAVQFPNDQELPLSLVEKITRYRAEIQRGLKKKSK